MEHALLAPSAAHCWVPCPGSVQMESKFPEVVNDDTENGTAAHWVAAGVLKSYGDSSRIILPTDYIEKVAPNSIIITDEMAEAAQVYVSDVLATAQEYGLLRKLHIEQPIKTGDIHKNNWGTPDCWVYDESTKQLFIWDFKFGHRVVYAYKNWQLMNYAFLILHGITGIEDCNITLRLRVVQPRCYQKDGPIDEFATVAVNLRGERNIMIATAEQAMGKTPSIQTGAHCRDCRARHSCKGAQQASQAAMQYSASFPSSLVEMSPQDAGIELDMLRAAADSIKFLLTGLEAKVLTDLKTGSNILGWAIKMGLGRQKWIKDPQEIFTLGDLIGVDLKQPNKPITPRQAVQKGVDQTVINAYSETPKTGLKLVKDDGTKARKVFSK